MFTVASSNCKHVDVFLYFTSTTACKTCNFFLFQFWNELEKYIFLDLALYYNYRPISVLPDMSINRISGFRPFHSNRDNRKINLAVFIDLKKAFDTVDHEIVLPKLFLCGIQGTELHWFKSIFLIVSNKLLYTYVNGVLSSSENYSNILCGVPQSSIFYFTSTPIYLAAWLTSSQTCMPMTPSLPIVKLLSMRLIDYISEGLG